MPDKVRLSGEWERGHWLEGHPVTALGGDTVIGTILSTGKDDDGFYALVELTPEARGLHVEEEVHPFG